MAQRPWDILKEKNSSLEEASEFLKKSVREWTTLGLTDSKTTAAVNIVAVNESKFGEQDPLRSSKPGANPPIAGHLLSSLFQLSNALEHLMGADEKDRRRRKVFDGVSAKSGNVPTQFPFRKLRVRGLVQCLPACFDRPEFGIRLFLAEFLMKYVPEFEGVCCAFRKLRAVDDRGFICDAEKLGVIMLRVDIEVLVFGPRQAYTLPARVSDVRESSIELLLLDTWEVTIPSNRLVEGSVLSRKWIDEATGQPYQGLVVKVKDPLKPNRPPGIIKTGSEVKFSVVKINCGASQESNYFQIQGSLRASDRFVKKPPSKGERRSPSQQPSGEPSDAAKKRKPEDPSPRHGDTPRSSGTKRTRIETSDKRASTATKN